MQILSVSNAYILLIVFALVMIILTSLTSCSRHTGTAEGFLAAGRQVPWWLGAVSIAVSWIWAPALFVSVQLAYQQGLPGLFWFVFPNILCLFIMAPLALRIRDKFPVGYSQPEWIRFRLGKRVQKLYLVPFLWYQLMAVTVQLYAGGRIFSFLTGTRIETVMIVLAITTLTYGIISGMRASIVTDMLQYAMIILGGLIIVPWTFSAAGGWTAVTPGLGGVSGLHTNVLDLEVACNFGIVTTIGLISGVLSDQQHWQRAFTIRKDHILKAYIISGLLFAIVPLALSVLGFIAANSAMGITLAAGIDPAMIGVAAVAHFLPNWAVVIFLIMLLCGLCSTLDSGLCAASSLYSMNMCSYTSEENEIRRKMALGVVLSSDEIAAQAGLDTKIVKSGRQAMIAVMLSGLLVALAVVHFPGFQLQYLWWTLNTVAACVAAPTVLSFYADRISPRGVFRGIVAALILGLPLFVYASATDKVWLNVAAVVGIVVVTAVSSLIGPRKLQVQEMVVHAPCVMPLR